MRATVPALRLGLVVMAAALAVGASAAAQTRLDGILFKFSGGIVTLSDVRQVRLLGLLQPANDSDEAYVNAIVNRRLMLTELRRNPPPEPTPEAVDAQVGQWQARVAGRGKVADLLGRAGMTEAELHGWFRDDLRIQAYLDERFGSSAGRTGQITSWIGVLRQRAGIK